ncbi:MAG: hypothetical protein RBS80_23960 [Thermoguttaceae bacterium]|jgi:hypothetical protein|nr:hypothetical protein [Thermoguttaceae bacterium]
MFPLVSHTLPLTVATFAVLVSAPVHAQDARRPKKLIATGWDHVDPVRFRENSAEMDTRPFDGVVVSVSGQTPEGRTVPLNWAFLKGRWDRAWFQDSVDVLKQCRSGRLTDNFVLLNANPGNVDWFDDEGWADIIDHCRIAAWVAKQGGMKGILFDPEPYAQPHAAFSYPAQPRRDEHTFAEYFEQARRRGREMMKAIAEEYPDITLFCYFMNSVVVSATGNADSMPALSTMGYGLYPALIDGWLDAAPPTVAFVDGCESAYRYNSVLEYLESAVAIKGACQELVSPGNRAKYRAQVQVSFGIYLDAYWNPDDSPWYIDGLGGSRVDRLRVNTATALRVADEYVWVYGEKFRWWPTPNPRVGEETWPEALPGCGKVLAYVRDPVGYAKGELAEKARAGCDENLVANSDFSAAETVLPNGQTVQWSDGRPPAGWGAWQHESSNGVFLWDRAVGSGAARAAGVESGCFLQAHPVEPGQRYAIAARVRTQGAGDTWLRVRWQTAEGRWTAEIKDRMLFPGTPNDDGWREVFGVVEVPEEVGSLVILLGVGNQPSPDDAAWFDQVQLHRLP